MLARKLYPSYKLKRLLSVYLFNSSHIFTSNFTSFSTCTSSATVISNPCFQNPLLQFLPCSPFSLQINKKFSSQSLDLIREGNFDEVACQGHQICPGCGVYMQGLDPKLPGFYIKPTLKNPDYKLPISRKFVIDEPEVSNSLKRGVLNELVEPPNPPLNPNLCEKPVVCARCHSLRHYGMVKDASVENLLPDFDFDHTVGRKLATASGGRSVVLLVVDAADFDGSFPKRVAKLVSSTIDQNLTAWKEGKSGNVPRMVLVLSKLDLLPSSLSPTRLEHWIRQRAREGGANKLTSVHMVSAVRDWGVKNLIEDVVRLVGSRGNVWAIGAQNAGKSTLINAIGKHVTGKVAPITEAPVPGTTLGIIRLDGILPGKAKLLDTPGLLHPHHIATRLTRDEHKLVQINKEVKPRTYRIKVGHTIHIAGLARLDVEELSVESIYVTVWASPFLPLHMGKTENAGKMITDHFGRQLQEFGHHVQLTTQIKSSDSVKSAGVEFYPLGGDPRF
ncbi:GTP-binding protein BRASSINAZOLE INSENSITIVE PALE GREEN 2, chloroplastic isoform X2 [Beta vulgaris subsp. vulgaris]|uniref:GTP-binding protein BRASSINAZOLE INSENSITIVE PALE GREEN 2, chloroplastic isoform X2 n=1 Tax=Beta vulgaris subsp. vulgaris TaxID=3555 RepID=UPI00053FC901|nr:GTP-binding protein BRASSINAZOLE INSENSITIVE PALE GREEN 2, chloroplastic isoform X2 [Beta vulgaris subsp. vulgaris]